MRSITAALVFAVPPCLLLFSAAPGAAQNAATYVETIDLTYQNMVEVFLRDPDDANPGTLVHMDSGPGVGGLGPTSFSGSATTSVGGAGGGLLPVTRAEAEAEFANLVLVDFGEGFARASAEIGLEFIVTPINPQAPTNVPVPLEFLTLGFVSVTGDGTSLDSIQADAALSLIRSRSGGGFQLLGGLSVSVLCGGSDPICPAAPLSASLDDTLTGDFVPATDVGFLFQRASGGTVPRPGSAPHVLGSYETWIDPIVRIDPTFMVDIDGTLVSGSELYALAFSENVMVPEPGTAALIGVGLLGVLVTARRQTPCET